jgi:hypothetical protein
MKLGETSHLVNTSIDDMRSSIQCAEINGSPYSIEHLKLALVIVMRRGEKTKTELLEAVIKKYEKRNIPI